MHADGKLFLTGTDGTVSVIEPGGDRESVEPHMPIAVFADPLFTIIIAAVIGRRRQARQRTDLPTVAELPPAEELHHQDPGGHRLVDQSEDRFAGEQQRLHQGLQQVFLGEKGLNLEQQVLP